MGPCDVTITDFSRLHHGAKRNQGAESRVAEIQSEPNDDADQDVGT